MRKKYNTPHRSRVVKTRLTEDEYARLHSAACALWYQPVGISPAGDPAYHHTPRTPCVVGQ